MNNYCILCKTMIYERAHIVAKRYLPINLHLMQNIIPLCPTCHTMFDKGYITIHPEYKIFIFSKARERLNLLAKYEYSYPHNDLLQNIPKRHLINQVRREFLKNYGQNELEKRFPTKPPIQKIYQNYVLKD